MKPQVPKHSTYSHHSSPLVSDPNSLIDTIDTFHSFKSSISVTQSNEADENISSSSDFDPIDFLNHHFQTESSLVSSLPLLRQTLSTRLDKLDESISITIQKQADLADITLSDVNRAKEAILQLYNRIKLVQSKAQLSEKAVQEITRDMKRLDYAKKHLSKTITALKRLHMLIHAITQLGVATETKPHPDYVVAVNLLDATRLLLGHFEGYMASVGKMRALKYRVDVIRKELKEGIVFGFRIVGFGFTSALEMEQEGNVKKSNNMKNRRENNKNNRLQQRQHVTRDNNELKPIPMPSEVLTSACHVLTALGPTHKSDFIQMFCLDHLTRYRKLFDPSNNTESTGEINASAILKPSFKIRVSSGLNDNSQHGEKENATLANPNPASLDQVERRYAWYRRMLRDLEDKFPNIFPHSWNVHYYMTHAFLKRTGLHFSVLFSSKTLRDRDCKNVTVLLKALQKTILFEKEMTAWLQREYGVVFSNAGDHNSSGNSSIGTESCTVLGDDGKELEFDDSGTAVAASSAEGIKIKYERKIKERKKNESKSSKEVENVGLDLLENQTHDDENDAKLSVLPNPPLIGVGSGSFDKYMQPYIALEEQNMKEQLSAAAVDTAVDARGELPVFTSSTCLFVYIKNSITRCTVLTRGATFFSLYLAFKDTLRKYSQVLFAKIPPALSGAAVTLAATFSGSSSGVSNGGANVIFRIPSGEETTVCHVIDTCEYCAETVEALQDLITDKTEKEYKNKIDMTDEQEIFHDVIAKGLHVLVSGLEQRTGAAFKEMSIINWSNMDMVGEESKYVRNMHNAIQPFVVTVKSLLPSSYFRSFCDKFATAFTNTFYNEIVNSKRISESGSQQLLLDVYNLKNLMLKLPVIERKIKQRSDTTTPSTLLNIAPAMYTKMVSKQFQSIETLLKLVGTPAELLIDVFKVQWGGGSALDLQIVMNLKGMKRNEQSQMLEKFGLDPIMAAKGATSGVASISENFQVMKGQSSDVAAKVNSDLSQMRQKVEDFRKAFR